MSREQSPVEALVGTRVGTEPIGDAERCDACSATIVPGDFIGVFFTNTPFDESLPTPYPFRIHCLECEHESLRWSPQGFGELLVLTQLTGDKTIATAKPRDYSPQTEGPPYSPVSVLSELFNLPEEYILEHVLPGQNIMSAQDFIHTLIENDMDPRKVIDMETGEPTITGEEKYKFFERVFMQYTDGTSM